MQIQAVGIYLVQKVEDDQGMKQNRGHSALVLWRIQLKQRKEKHTERERERD